MRVENRVQRPELRDQKSEFRVQRSFSIREGPDETIRCRAILAHIRQSRPYSGLGFQAKVLKILLYFPLFARDRFLHSMIPSTLDVQWVKIQAPFEIKEA